MKGSERHRLKENELSHVIADAGERLRENRGPAAVAGGIVLLALVVGGGYWAWTTRANTRAQNMLAEAIVVAQAPVEEPGSGAKPSPGSYPTVQARSEASLAKFTAVYEAYPATPAGIAARYHAAAALAMLGRYAEAATQFQEVASRAGAGTFYGRMARLGAIDANTQAKRFDEAIGAAQALVNNTADETIPRDALLMELGRVQAAAGKKAEAKQTFDKVIAEFPDSPFADEAKRLIAELT